MLTYSKGEMIALGIVLPSLASSAVILRLYVHLKKMNSRLSLDDVLITLGLIFTWGIGICLVVGATVSNYGQHSHLGPHQSVAEGHYSTEDRHVEWAVRLIDPFTFGFIKLSVLTFYRRLFKLKPWFNIASWFLIGLVICWTISFFFAYLFQCKPLTAIYGTREQLFHDCVNTYVLNRAYVDFDVVTDVLILSLPIPMVLSLHMTPRKKAGVIGVFLLGTLAIAAGAARLAFIYIAASEGTTDPDVSYLLTPVIYWAVIEASLAVVAACLPTFAPLWVDFSLERAIHSVRSAISLSSMRSNGSPGHGRRFQGDRIASDGNFNVDLERHNEMTMGTLKNESTLREQSKMPGIDTSSNVAYHT